jgi:uncharacterized OB-fold protein
MPKHRRRAMERECAFCGCVTFPGATRRVYCEDCHAEHEVCPACAEDVVGEDGLRLVA